MSAAKLELKRSVVARNIVPFCHQSVVRAGRQRRAKKYSDCAAQTLCEGDESLKRIERKTTKHILELRGFADLDVVNEKSAQSSRRKLS